MSSAQTKKTPPLPPTTTTTATSSTPLIESSSESTTNDNKLWTVHIANLVAYVLNVVITYAVGATEWWNLPSNAELSAKYQTLVTPAGVAFSIWGIIFVSQFVWVIAQVLPSNRGNLLVIQGVGYNYVGICLAQIAWTIVFALESIILSLVAMISILILLVWTVQRMTPLRAESIGGYWLWKFPLEIHAAWIVAATLVNSNVVLVYLNVTTEYQIIGAWLSLFLLVNVGLYYTTILKLYVFPCVLSWASFFIYKELTNARESITTTFAQETIASIQKTCLGFSILLLVMVVWTLIYNRFYQQQQPRNQPQS